MKRRIEHFVKTYFYFNRNERKGLLSLLALMGIFQTASFFYASFSSQELPKLKNLPFEQLSYMDDENKVIRKEDIEHKQNKFGTHYLPNKYKKRDTLFVYPEPKKFLVLELNSIDSFSLVSLPKIGPVLAQRIVQYRDRLGGFHSLSQLKEVYGFKEDYLYDLEGKIYVDSSKAQNIYLNQVDLNTLRQHPYFKYTLSSAIINYRKQHGAYKEGADLRKIKIVNDSIYSLILPYCKFN